MEEKKALKPAKKKKKKRAHLQNTQEQDDFFNLQTVETQVQPVLTEQEGEQRIQFFTEEAEDSKIEKVFDKGNYVKSSLNRSHEIKRGNEDKNSSCKCLIF